MEKFNFNTSVGRFVSGDIVNRRTRDHQGKPITDPDKMTFDFGVAFPKTDPAIQQVIMDIVGYTKQAYAAKPHVAAQLDQWVGTLNGMSMKISDGDAANQRGQVNPNTAGHYVFYFSSNFEINCCRLEGTQNIQIPATDIKRGWFVQMSGNVQPNNLDGANCGIYMNPGWMRLIAEGDEITGGMSADEAFGATPAPTALPPGARPLGSAPQTALPGTTPGAQPGMMPGAQTVPLGGASAPVTTQTAAPAQGSPQTVLPGAVVPGAQTTASPSEQQHPQYHAPLGAGLPQ